MAAINGMSGCRPQNGSGIEERDIDGLPHVLPVAAQSVRPDLSPLSTGATFAVPQSMFADWTFATPRNLIAALADVSPWTGAPHVQPLDPDDAATQSIIPDYGSAPGPENVDLIFEISGEYTVAASDYLYGIHGYTLFEGGKMINYGTIWSDPQISNLAGALFLGTGPVENHGKMVLLLDHQYSYPQHAIAIYTNDLTNTGEVWCVATESSAITVSGDGATVHNSGLLAAQAVHGFAKTIDMYHSGLIVNEVGGEVLAEGLGATAMFNLDGGYYIGGANSVDPDVVDAQIENAGLIQAVALDHSSLSVGIWTAHEFVYVSKIVNTGTIRADIAIYGDPFAATTTVQKPIDIVYNEPGGLIDGDILLERGNDVVRNHGTIEGSVVLGEGNDTFDNVGGVLQGIADLGWDDDVFHGGAGVDLVRGDDGNDTIEGNNGADLLMGGSNDDVITGGLGHDGLYGEYGNDRIVTQSGDHVSGGPGDDRIELGDYIFEYVSGDEGFDTLVLPAGARALDLSMVVATGRLNSIEEIALNGSKDVIIRPGDIAALTDGGGELRIDGEAGDDIFLIGNWSSGGTTTIDGTVYRQYALGSETVLVDDGASVTVTNSPPTGTGLDPVASGAAAPTPGPGAGLDYTPNERYLVYYELSESVIINPEEVWWNDGAGPVLYAENGGLTITNYGTIASINDSYATIFARALGGNNLEYLFNYGTISTRSTVLDQGYTYGSGGGTYNTTNAGLIEAVTETGTAIGLTSFVATSSGEVYAYSGDGEAIGVNVPYFDNSGAITAIGKTAATGAMLVCNQYHAPVNSGFIEAITRDGRGADSIGVRIIVEDSLATFENSGTIKADIAILTVALETNPKFTLTNEGDLLGRVVLGDNPDEFTNTGTVGGAVLLGGGNDVFDGTRGIQTGIISGQDGDDQLMGGSSAESLSGGAGDDTLDGALGSDTASYGDATSGVAVSLLITTAQAVGGGQGSDRLVSIENLEGSAFDDVLTGNGAANVLAGDDGDDTLNGGAGGDTLVAGSGNDTVIGGPGSDDFLFEGNLSTADVVRGDAGFDTIILDGDYSLVFSAAMLTAVEGIHLDTGHNYILTFDDANVASGKRLIVNGVPVGSANAVTIDGSHETNGKFTLTGGAGADHLTGGALGDKIGGGGGNDVIVTGAGVDMLTGGMGADTLNSGTGPDTYVYGAAKESTGAGYDTLIAFNALGEHIDLTTAVTGIDAEVTAGMLSTGTFDSNLHAILDAAHLLQGHAVLVTPDSGDLAGQKFLVVEMNGVAGYQAGKDLVLHLDSATHLGDLSVSDFI